ncbi:hypothetical protein ACH429_17755 [Streptomyces pathocidini]|uniref:Lipoprotein n=1 Tax=Streptomyces pathocidini TaxID=1650571 RepID=A0ABW7UTX7_9ACTN|nr:hypothetical protein [Streptomyces pathocidini]
MVVHRHGRKGGAVAAVMGSVAVGLVATGCSGMGAAADDRGSVDDATATAVVRRAADVLVRSGSSRARTSMETATGGTRVTIRGEGAFDYARQVGRLLVSLPRDAAGGEEHRPVTELLTPGALYMKDRGAGVPADKWVRVDTTGLADGNLVTGGATDPMAAAELLRGARDVRYVGEAKAEGDGATVRHYRGVTDIGRAAKASSPHVRGVLAAAAKGFSEDVVPFDAYLDEQGRLRKVRHRFSFANSGHERGGERVAAEVVSTTVLYGFGTDVTIELPPEQDIYSGAIAVPEA